MSNTPPNPLDWVEPLLLGELDPERTQALERWLGADDANRAAFLREVQLCRGIRRAFLATDNSQALDDLWDGELAHLGAEGDNDPDVMSEVIDLALAERRKHELEDEANRKLAAQQAEDARRRRYELRRSATPEPVQRVIVIPKPLVWLGLAAAVGLLASVVYLTLPSNPPLATDPSPSARNPESAGTHQAQPVQVARVIDTLDARWGNGQAVMDGDRIFDRPYDLADGIVQLELTSGVTLTVEGPALLVPDSDMVVSLHHGKLVGLVPEQANGFVVRTPTMDIVDLGTEFGIEVGEGRGGEVHVLDGSVRLEPGLTAHTFQPIVAQAGEAIAVVDMGVPEGITSEPSAFYRYVPVAYERLIRDANPLAYWRFNSQASDQTFSNYGPSGASLQAEGNINLRRNARLSDDPDNFALWLNTRGPSIQSVQPIGLDADDAFTLEAWVWVPSSTSHRRRLVSNNMLDEEGLQAGGFAFGVSGSRGDVAQAGGPVLIFTSCSVFDAFSETPVPTDRWVHVAVSLDSQRGTLRLMIDGKQVPHRIDNERGYTQHPGYNGELFVPPSNSPVRVGDALTQFNAGGEYWIGGIDELAIYGSVLSTEILATHAAGTRQAGN